jgi:hypothetical protein
MTRVLGDARGGQTSLGDRACLRGQLGTDLAGDRPPCWGDRLLGTDRLPGTLAGTDLRVEETDRLLGALVGTDLNNLKKTS